MPRDVAPPPAEVDAAFPRRTLVSNDAGMHPVRWLRGHDPGLGALRRAARAAINMPALFALGAKVLDNAELATFAAFGAFAMLLLVDFRGSVADRLQAMAALGAAGAVLVCLGALASRHALLAAGAWPFVGFGVLFAGVVSSVLAGASTSLLLAFILPVSLSAPATTIPSRLAGWALASCAALLATWLLWPLPSRDPLRGPAAAASRALAARIRSDVAHVLGGDGAPNPAEHAAAVEAGVDAVAALRRTFLASPQRPTGLSTATRTVVRLVDELTWLEAIVLRCGGDGGDAGHRGGSDARADGRTRLPATSDVCAVRLAAAEVLDAGAVLLEGVDLDPRRLRAALPAMDAARTRMEARAMQELPVGRARVTSGAAEGDPDHEQRVTEFVTSLDPGFRAQELAFAASLVGENVDRTAAAERRSPVDRLLGRQPEGLPGALSA